MTHRASRILPALFSSCLLASCVGTWTEPEEAPPGTTSAGQRNEAFTEAADRFDVRREVLVAYAHIMGRLEVPTPEHGESQPAEEHGDHGHTARFGIMQLDETQAAKGAGLAGLPVDQVKNDLRSNVMAGAALIRHYGDAHTGETGRELSWEAYRAAAAKVAGVEDAMLAEDFGTELTIVLGDGISVVTSDGEPVASPGVDGMGSPGRGETVSEATAPGQYPPLAWYPAHTNNYRVGRNGGSVKYVVIHNTEGYFWGTIDWFQQANPSRASTQYVIRSSDGYIAQMVAESNGAWHAGNDYYSMNSIGIEHEGYQSNPSYWFTEAMYQSSSKLVCAIAVKYNIPVDRQHIIGHYQIPDPFVISPSAAPGTNTQTANCFSCYGGAGQHTDPGRNGTGWKWDYYMGLVKSCVDAARGGGTTPPPPSGNVATLQCSGSGCWPSGDLQVGNTGNMVYLLQQDLVYKGHLNPTDMLTGPGTFGELTKAAVIRHQAASSLSQSGYYGTATAGAMGTYLKANQPAVPAQNLSYGMTSAAVTSLQQKLTSIGYSVPATGYFGTITQSKVLEFQKARGVPGGDGSYGALTRMALAGRIKRGW